MLAAATKRTQKSDAPVVLFLKINHRPGGYHLSLGKSFKMEQKKGQAFLHPLFFLSEQLLRGAGRSFPSLVLRRAFLSPLTRVRTPQREASPHLPLLPFLSPSCGHDAFLGSPRLSWGRWSHTSPFQFTAACSNLQ